MEVDLDVVVITGRHTVRESKMWMMSEGVSRLLRHPTVLVLFEAGHHVHINNVF